MDSGNYKPFQSMGVIFLIVFINIYKKHTWCLTREGNKCTHKVNPSLSFIIEEKSWPQKKLIKLSNYYEWQIATCHILTCCELVPHTFRARKGDCHFMERLVLPLQSDRFHGLSVLMQELLKKDSILEFYSLNV